MPVFARILTVRLHRAERIGEAIWRRWQVAPAHWQVKQVRWYLEYHCRDLAPSSRYDHWRTVRALLHALAKAENWLPHLQRIFHDRVHKKWL